MTTPAHITTDEAIRRIRAALAARSDRPWRVHRGAGSARGWIVIEQPTNRIGIDRAGDGAELARLFRLPALSRDAIPSISVPDSQHKYREYVGRAEACQDARLFS